MQIKQWKVNSAILVDRLFTNKQKFVFWIFVYYHLHDVLALPNDRISVEVSSGVEPEIEHVFEDRDKSCSSMNNQC